jgi:hypothetical protein
MRDEAAKEECKAEWIDKERLNMVLGDGPQLRLTNSALPSNKIRRLINEMFGSENLQI